MTLSDVTTYIEKMYNGTAFFNLTFEQQEKAFFTAFEMLQDYYSLSSITTRTVALQALYLIESEDEEYGLLRRQGVSSFKSKDVQVSIASDPISPEVKAILGNFVKKGKVGRLV